jgi:hypothetical protein
MFTEQPCLKLAAAKTVSGAPRSKAPAEEASALEKLSNLMKPSLHDPMMCQPDYSGVRQERRSGASHGQVQRSYNCKVCPPCVAVASSGCLKHWEYKINGSMSVSKWFAIDGIDTGLREPS